VTTTQPLVQSAIASFTRAVNSAKSMIQLLANPAFMRVLLTANGMSNEVIYTCLVTKMPTSNLRDSSSLANKSTDASCKTAATNHDFSSAGLASFRKPATFAAIAGICATETRRTGQDPVTPRLSKARALRAQAASITSVDQILGNATTRAVITTTLDAPQHIPIQSIKAQEQAISKRIDIKRFQDPKFAGIFARQNLIANAAAAAGSSSTALSTLTVQCHGILA
jgi:hypothetical protein